MVDDHLINVIKDLIKKIKIEIEKGKSFIEISNKASSSFFNLGKRTVNKDCIIISFLLRSMREPLIASIEKNMEKIFPDVLEKRIEEEKNELVKKILDFLRRKDLKSIYYYKLIDYGVGRVDFEGVQSSFNFKNLELPIEIKGFILLSLAKALEEAWKKAYTDINELVKDHMDKLEKTIESIESDEEILNELKKGFEDILYALHLKALGE